jgi:hypothetical protein
MSPYECVAHGQPSIPGADNTCVSTYAYDSFEYNYISGVCWETCTKTNGTVTEEIVDDWYCGITQSGARFDECDTQSQGYLDANQVISCYNTNCDRECTVSNTLTAAEIANSTWCECVYHEPQVLLELYDWNYNGQLERHEYTMMFNTTTDIYNGSWPYSAQKEFDDCDENRDMTLDTSEVEKCYERRCVEECTLQEAREYRE